MKKRDLIILAVIISIVLIVMCCTMIFICFELVKLNNSLQTLINNFDSLSSFIMNIDWER